MGINAIDTDAGYFDLRSGRRAIIERRELSGVGTRNRTPTPLGSS
jgi:hypothetical protein